MKNIQVSKEVWKILRDIKKDHKFKHFNEVIKWLLFTVFYSDKNTVEVPKRELGQIEKQLFIDKTTNFLKHYKLYTPNHSNNEPRYPENKYFKIKIP
jgi:hypothetical protein